MKLERLITRVYAPDVEGRRVRGRIYLSRLADCTTKKATEKSRLGLVEHSSYIVRNLMKNNHGCGDGIGVEYHCIF